MAKWLLQQTEPRNDGSGNIQFEIWGVEDDGEKKIPGKHTWVDISAAEVDAALALPTNAQIGNELKRLIGLELDEADWSEEALDTVIIANENAFTVDAELDTLIETEFGGYPRVFSA